MSFKIMYQPKGRALEYADYAINIYSGCNFGCTYCFVPQVLHMDRSQFHTQCKVRDDLLAKVEHDAKQSKGLKVLLCFTCDPYQDIDVELEATREVMKILNRYDVNWSVLTKGGMRATRDFDLYKPGDSFGSTLTFFTTKDSELWEPHARDPQNRVMAIHAAHKQGIRTWVSLEPVIDPDQTLDLIDYSHSDVDLFKVGMINYNPISKEIDWKYFTERFISKMQLYGKEYYIKEDLRKAAGIEQKGGAE